MDFVVYGKRIVGYEWFRMETNRLLQFRVVVETGNLRKAAALLNMSHSGLSKSMKVLESELGISLFQASGRGIVVSDEGQSLYERSTRFISEFERLVGNQSDSAKSANQVLRIGSFETFTSYFVGEVLKLYLPDFEAEVHELVPGRLEDALFYNKVDIGITYEPVPRKGIDYVKVTALTMGVFALRERFTDRDISEVPFVVPVSPLDGAPSAVKGRDSWPDGELERNVLYRVDLMSTGLEMARQGLAAIFIPLAVAKLHNQRVRDEYRLEPLKLPRSIPSVKRDVYIVKRESTFEDKALRRIARALRDLCSEE